MNIRSLKSKALFACLLVSSCGGGGGSGRTAADPSISVQGSLKLPNYYQLDWDVPTNRTVRNDSVNQAQPLITPFNLTGYLDPTDTQDYFQMTLTERSQLLFDAQAGLSARIQVAEIVGQAPVSPFLLAPNSNGNLDLVQSDGSPLTGSILLQISRATDEDSNKGAYRLYLTNIPQDPNGGAVTTRALQAKKADTVHQPDQVTLVFDWDQAPLSQLDIINTTVSATASATVVDQLEISLEKLSHVGNTVQYKIRPTENQVWTSDLKKSLLNALEALEDVRFAEFSQPIKSQFTLPKVQSNDEYYDKQWYLEQLKVPLAWSSTLGSNEVTVAILDTGILSHPDLPGYDSRSYDFITSDEISQDGDGGPDADPTDQGDGQPSTGNQNYYHGTNMAGVIGASANNSSGITGINWDVSLIHLRVLGALTIDENDPNNRGNGTTTDLARAIKYAAGENVSDTKKQQFIPQIAPVDIINLSLSASEPSRLVQEAIEIAVARGVIVVAATGNESASQISFPASMSQVIGVGATDRNQVITSYSNQGLVSLAAPGGYLASGIDQALTGVLSTAAVDTAFGLASTYRAYPGTSIATALTSGVLALMKSVHPNLSPTELNGLLQTGALTQDLGNPGYDSAYGYGFLQADKAVAAADTLAQTGSPEINRGVFSIRLVSVTDANKAQTLTVQEGSNPFAFNFSAVEPGNYDIQAGQDLNGNSIICEADAFELCSSFTTTIPVQTGAITGLFIEMQ